MTTCVERERGQGLHHGKPTKACPACATVCCGGCLDYPVEGLCVACGTDKAACWVEDPSPLEVCEDPEAYAVAAGLWGVA